MIVAGEDAFSYALRTAYLHYLLQPRARRQVPVPPSQNANRHSTINIQDLVLDFSRGDFSRGLGNRGGDAKSIRLPKDFMPALRKRIEGVVVGQDRQVEYRDQAVKRTFGSFYSAFVEPRYYDTTAKSRRPEDLLLIFYTHATKELQTLRPDDWKTLVDRHVALFVRLMGHILKDQGWNSSNPELANRLATLEKKLLRHDENLAEEGGSGGRGSSSATMPGPPEPPSNDVNEMPMVKTVSRVFNVPLDTCQQEIMKNKASWTEKAAFQDMKQYMNNLNTGVGSTLRAEDFDLYEAYEAWSKAEKAELSELILVMGRMHQDLLKSSTSSVPTTRPGHAYSLSGFDGHRTSTGLSRASMYETTPTHCPPILLDANGPGNEDDESPYTYIPPDPRVFYRHVVSRCLTSDLNDPDTEFEPIDIPGADEPIRLLSKPSLDLINQCALRWRLPKFSRMVLFLDALRIKYQEGEIGLSMLDGAFLYFDKEVDSTWVAWTTADQTLCRQLLTTVHDFILREMYDILQHAYDAKAIPIGPVMWVLDQHIYSNELFTPSNMDEYIDQLKEGLKNKAHQVLQHILEEEIFAKHETEKLDPLHVVTTIQRITKLGEKIQKRFKQPVLGAVDPMPIFVEAVFPQFAIEAKQVVEHIIQTYRDEGTEMSIEDGFELYKELSEIRRIYLDVNPKGQFPVDLEDLFVEFPKRWLQTVDSKVLGWVEAATRQDTHMLQWPEGEEIGEKRHTSSVVDIFRSFNQSIDAIKKLEWQNEYQYAKFMTILSKILGKGIMRYCEELECLFTHEMTRKTPEEEAAATQTRQQKWMAMAKEAWSNKEKVEPYQFALESCLKLNNIEFATQQFDKLERSIGADRLAEIIEKNEPPRAREKKNSTYVFTIKIMEAEDLKAMDIGGGSDPYVVLGDEYQKRLAKTRIVYNNLNPRWEESFDITTTGSTLLVATLWDWDTMGDHDCLGRASLKLDPSNFMDYLPKEYWLDLDTQGRLLLRISMEGERDDIQFHFGKAFRTLKRTERDMTRQITDKLSSYIHHCLSRSALKNVLSKGYNMSAVTGLFSRAGFGTRPQSSQSQAVTEADIAGALAPLTDYFNENFAILNQALTPTAMTLVMTKLWKEVLVTLEALLVPTLSDKPSQQKQLTQQEMEVVFKWLQLMLDFFLAVDETTGEATGVPMSLLKSPKYHELQTLNFFYFEPTNDLIRNSERIGNAAAAKQQAMRQKLMGQSSSSGSSLTVPGVGRSKSVLNKRNLGTIRKAKEERWREAQAEPSDDMILRILRMRPEAAGYLRDRAKQKERLESIAAMDAIVAKSVQQGPGRMGRLDTFGRK